MNFLKGWRTVVFNLVMFLAALVSLASGVDVTEDGTRLVDGFEMVIQGGIAIWTIGNLWLRYITDSPIFSKEVTYNYKNKR